MGTSFLLILLALHTVWAIDTGLKRMCLSPHVDSPSETKDLSNRIKGSTCVQTFPYDGTKEQHETFCRSKMPYDFKVASRTKTSVTCQWSVQSTRCDHSRKKRVYQINGKCFTVKDSCSKKSLSLAKPATIDQLRWLSIFYGNSETALRIEAGKAFKVKDEFRYDDGNVFKTGGGGGYKKVALMVGRLAPFEQFPGSLLPSDSSMLRELCLAKTKVSGTAASPLFSLPFGTGDGKEGRKTFGSGSSHIQFPLTDGDKEVGFAFITRNDYVPQFADDGFVDLDHFHKQCESICTDCYAASFEMFEEYQSEMPEGRFYAPAGRRDSNRDGKCKAEFNMANRKRFNVKPNTHKKSKPYIPKGRHWWNGDSDSLKLPTASCTDQARTAVQLVNTDELTYVDVPSFDRRPIVCISGPATAAIQKDKECFPNSKMSNGKCVCKNTYQDALDMKEFRQNVLDLGFNKHGQVCVKPQSCKEHTRSGTTGIIFLVDGSGSVEETNYIQYFVPFVQSFADTLPNNVPILFYQFADRGEEASEFLDKGWSKDDYKSTMNAALFPYKSGGTATYTHMWKAIHYGDQQWGAGKKVLIVLTDGDTGDKKDYIIEQREKLGYDTVFITIGYGVEKSMRAKERGNLRVSFYGITNFSGLGSELVNEITENICEPFPEGHLLKAIYGDDWKDAT